MALILPEQEQPEARPQPAPVNIMIAADNATLTMSFGNGTFIQQVLSAETMQQICKVWLESRKELMKQQQIVAEVIKSKR